MLAAPIRSLEGSPRARLGVGALDEAGIVARELGIHRALVIADPARGLSPSRERLQVRLAENSVRPHVSTTVTPTPLYRDVETSVALGKAKDCDGVISIGGGSTLDIAKAAALILAGGGSIPDYAHGRRSVDATLPHLAISTTAGTGAESSAYAFLREDRGHEHTILHDPVLLPDAVIIDPETHVSMPRNVTAATGLNALSDAIEAMVSPAAIPDSDRVAARSIQLIMHALPAACSNGTDLDARTAMAEGAFLAGQAFDTAGLGIIDSISLVLSNLYAVGHSDANAMILSHALRSGEYGTPEGRERVADAMGTAEPAEAVEFLRQRIDHTGRLADYGIGWDALYLCAGSILSHPFNNRWGKHVDERGLADILVSAMDA